MTTAIAPATTDALAAQFALLADPLRLQIIQALAAEQMCTCHLIDLTGAKQTTISHHLRILREADMVTVEAAGRFTWYRLADGAFDHAARALSGIVPTGPAPRLKPTC